MNQRTIVTIVACTSLCLAVPGAARSGPHQPVAWQRQASEQEILLFADLALEEMAHMVMAVEDMVEAAERDEHEAGVACLSSKLTTITLIHRAAAAVLDDCHLALEAGDLGMAEHQVRKIAIALSRMRQIHVNAELCPGVWPLGAYPPRVLDRGHYPPGDDTEALDAEDEFGPNPPETSPYQ
jgi:hypothetical protein